jgi:APA family basic amino acid/polyamine antiporter
MRPLRTLCVTQGSRGGWRHMRLAASQPFGFQLFLYHFWRKSRSISQLAQKDVFSHIMGNANPEPSRSPHSKPRHTKLGFWATLAFVISSQIGSGIFLLPSTLAPFGALGLLGWGIASSGALALALTFAHLCRAYPETGGLQVYISKAFGRNAGFFTAWMYWVLSWLGIAPVLGTLAAALATLFGWPESVPVLLAIELGVLVILTALNLRGVETAGLWELVLSAIKLVPLLIFPIAALFFVEPTHFTPFNPTGQPWPHVMSGAVLAMLWGFLGLEGATTPAGSVHEPHKTIPRALVVGTLLVASLYCLSTCAIMGVVPRDTLLGSVTPYSQAFELMWGSGSGLAGRVMAFFIAIVCLGSLNVWILATGQVAQGAADAGFFPAFFKRTNRNGAPVSGLIVNALCLAITLCLLTSKTMAEQICFIIEISVSCSLSMYCFAALALLKSVRPLSVNAIVTACIALLFCGWAFCGTSLSIMHWVIAVPLSGLPLWYTQRRRMLNAG